MNCILGTSESLKANILFHLTGDHIMKLRIVSVLLALALAFVGFTPKVSAQAYSTSYTTSITYQNVGTAATTTLQVLFYATPTTTSPIAITRDNLAAGAGTSLFIGSLSEISAGFRGSAVMVADQPLLATLVQLPQGSATVKNRPLSNGFSDGAAQSLIASVLKNMFDSNTLLSVQNVDTATNHITIKFYDTSATLVDTVTATVESGAAYYVDAGVAAGLGTSFNGSAVIAAKRADDTTDGKIISSAMELAIAGTGNKAFEGVASGAKTFYMPSALCAAYGADTAYAVQNTSLTTATDVTVTYSNGATETQNILPGAKKSFIACNATGMVTGYSGAATVVSATTDVVAIGKAYGSGLSTAFAGAASGSARVGLPYVRWASDANWANGSQQRAYLTIQNVGSATITGDIVVQYIDRAGTVVGTHTISDDLVVGAKTNSNATNAGLTEFGVYTGPQFGGGALVIGPAGSQLAVVARISTQVSSGVFASEDYNGMTAP
jgi:hypothetical protein